MKTLRGYSEKILRTHLWVAAIAYQRIAKIKKDTNGRYSFTEVATLIRGQRTEAVGELPELTVKH